MWILHAHKKCLKKRKNSKLLDIIFYEMSVYYLWMPILNLITLYLDQQGSIISYGN